jgi:nitrogen regulatory protein P-II 2
VLQLVTAIVKPHRLEAVQEALVGSEVTGMTVTEVKGFGRQGGHTEFYRGAEYQIDFVPKLRLDILCPPDQVDAVVAAVSQAAHTGKIGDGKLWLGDVEHATRIRTGEMGAEAL